MDCGVLTPKWNICINSLAKDQGSFWKRQYKECKIWKMRRNAVK